MKKRALVTVFFVPVFMLSACVGGIGGGDSNPRGEGEMSPKQPSTSGEECDLDRDDDEVCITGNVTYQDHELVVQGETNLPHGAYVSIQPQALDGSTFMGVGTNASIDEGGSFEEQLAIPDEYEYGLDVHVVFRVKDQADQVRQVYGDHGEDLEGPFVRAYEDSEQLMQEARASIYVPVDYDGASTGEFLMPEWQEPSDQGDLELRMEAFATGEEDLILVEGESNLMEGSLISVGLVDRWGRMRPGGGTVRANPDGSFQKRIEYPDNSRKVKGHSVAVTFEPSESDWANVIEAYGAQGENMSGSIVKNGAATVTVDID